MPSRLEGVVASVSEQDIVIDLGEVDGVTIGTRFSVQGENGKSFGVVKVIEVRDQVCVARKFEPFVDDGVISRVSPRLSAATGAAVGAFVAGLFAASVGAVAVGSALGSLVGRNWGNVQQMPVISPNMRVVQLVDGEGLPECRDGLD